MQNLDQELEDRRNKNLCESAHLTESVQVFESVCVSVCELVYVFVCVCVCVSVGGRHYELSVCLSVCASVSVSSCACNCMCIYVCVCIYINSGFGDLLEKTVV